VIQEPLERLASCHQQIEAQLDTLEKLVEHVASRGCDPVAQSAAGDVLRYFDELERGHSTMESQWQRLRLSLDAIAAKRKAALGAGEVARFAWLYRRHMGRESLLVLRFAKEVLTA
jgi:hypothetical protein